MENKNQDTDRGKKVTFYTDTAIAIAIATTITLKGCVYLIDTFKDNPNLMSIRFEDSGLIFDRDQFQLEEDNDGK